MMLAAVALGGALGAVLRFIVDGEMKAALGAHARQRIATLPWSTLCINVGGSALLGALSAAHLSPVVYAFLATGVCGGFTTFSTASVEAVTLVRAKRPGMAVAYAAFTLAACWAACLLGASLA